MKYNIQYGLALFLMFLCASAVAFEKPAYRFSANDLEGTPLNFDPANQTKPTLLIFWASWCQRCVAEMPQLKALHQQLDKDVTFIGVNLNRQSDDGLRVQQQQQLPYSSVADPDLALADQYKVKGTPTLILINNDGNEILRSHHLRGAIEDALLDFAT